MQHQPYIGITDFTHPGEVSNMLRVFNTHRNAAFSHKLHVGVMMSRRTLTGEEPERWAVHFPPNEILPEIFYSDKTINCIHYADFGDDPNFLDHLVLAIRQGGPFLNAFQLDMTWPDPKAISAALKITGKKLRIILQVGKKALEAIGGSYESLVDMLGTYKGIVHDVLLDESMGKGVPLDTEKTLATLKRLRVDLPQFGNVVAGGLGPDTLDLIEPIAAAFGDISIDAQGKLRPSGDKMDPIDWDMAERYLISALHMLQSD